MITSTFNAYTIGTKSPPRKKNAVNEKPAAIKRFVIVEHEMSPAYWRATATNTRTHTPSMEMRYINNVDEYNAVQVGSS